MTVPNHNGDAMNRKRRGQQRADVSIITTASITLILLCCWNEVGSLYDRYREKARRHQYIVDEIANGTYFVKDERFNTCCPHNQYHTETGICFTIVDTPCEEIPPELLTVGRRQPKQ